MPLPAATMSLPGLDHVLPYFRAVMPGVQGVVLATAHGAPLAADLDAGADAVAAQAVRLHREACGCAPLAEPGKGASILVPHHGGLVLVVFLAAA